MKIDNLYTLRGSLDRVIPQTRSSHLWRSKGFPACPIEAIDGSWGLF